MAYKLRNRQVFDADVNGKTLHLYMLHTGHLLWF